MSAGFAYDSYEFEREGVSPCLHVASPLCREREGDLIKRGDVVRAISLSQLKSVGTEVRYLSTVPTEVSFCSCSYEVFYVSRRRFRGKRADPTELNPTGPPGLVAECDSLTVDAQSR